MMTSVSVRKWKENYTFYFTYFQYRRLWFFFSNTNYDFVIWILSTTFNKQVLPFAILKNDRNIFLSVEKKKIQQQNYHKMTHSFSFPKLHFTYTHCFRTITNSSEDKLYICQGKLFPTFTYNEKVIWLLNCKTASWFVPVNCSFYSTTVDKPQG